MTTWVGTGVAQPPANRDSVSTGSAESPALSTTDKKRGVRAAAPPPGDTHSSKAIIESRQGLCGPHFHTAVTPFP
ncbi:hypothetical protein [Lentzea aerocolonigenes]|uniref:hypothetical protein n=1 Tax=Lentzea aerocolonigenes TaxID=68170 RepID=UPI000B2AB783|nr:hypothetical protein [Lentzea aerocolonigenes]MCP2245929.1 hypothetical protein [Lentzea aerocolonigenes]